MNKVRNREELQSYILKLMKDNSSVLEKKIFYNIAKHSKHFKDSCNKNKSNSRSFDFLKISFSYYDIIGNEKENISLVKEALLALQTKEIWFEEKGQEDTQLILLSIIVFSEIEEESDIISFAIHPMILDCICSMTEEQIETFKY